MFPKMKTPLRLTITLCLGLFAALSTGWAETYENSVVIKKKHRTGRTLSIHGVRVRIPKGALQSYLAENNLNEVEVRVTMNEAVVESEEGKQYQLSFTFAPYGCYFDKPLKLVVKGKRVRKGCDVWLFDAMGNEIDAERKDLRRRIIFKIHDFGVGTDSADDYEWDLFAASYTASKVMGVKGGWIIINSEAAVRVKRGALEEYLDELELETVEITAELYYGWDGSLLFVFGPSGAFFDPHLELKIQGGYVSDDMLLMDEKGEFLEYAISNSGATLIFFIPHFSEYSYDDYY